MGGFAASVMAALLIAGCAGLPERIAESYVGDAYYRTLGCQELAAARVPVQRELSRLTVRQSRYRGVLIAPGAARQNAERIAAYKGTLAAIDRARRANGCLVPA